MQIDINLGERSYAVAIKTLEGLALKDKKLLIVTNHTISSLHLEYLLKRLEAKELHIATIKDGEEYKNMETIEEILRVAFNAKLDRGSIFVAFGGGVIGDMTGFASGIFQRGVDFIQIPTTLLSMVDASVGGKTGINNEFGKNLVGLFHQPLSVHIDTFFLGTLPEREFGAGVAEIIKMAVTFDSKFFIWLEKNRLDNRENIEYAIKKCVEIKAKVVEMDEKESGIRAALNYGHTFGHAIENLTNYKTYLHGEAVSIGISMANRLASKLGNITKEEEERILHLLLSYNLPITFDIQDREEFYEKFFLDKKSKDSKITFVLPKSIGGVEFRDDISKEAVLEIL